MNSSLSVKPIQEAELNQATQKNFVNSATSAKLISFEGTEGVGKTTAINHLCERLQSQGIDYLRTREPGGSEFAEHLRSILLDPATDISDDTELLLMFTARSDHLRKLILPALASGQWVICDRFVDSSVAYQGYGRANAEPLMLDKIHSLIQYFVPRLPDLTLWLDLPVLEGMERAGKRSAADRFEQESIEFFQRVHTGYASIAKQSPNRFRRIDASGDSQQVAERIWQALI